MKLASRFYLPGDEHNIVSLYNQITGRSRTLAQHGWEWLATPEGAGSIWVIYEVDCGEVVGHHGLIPIRISYFGRGFLAGKTENTLLQPKYAGTGIYFLHESRFLQKAKQRFDLLFTTMGNGTPGKIRRKLGYRPVGGYINYLKILNPSAFDHLMNPMVEKMGTATAGRICRGVLRGLGRASMAFFRKRARIDERLELEVLTAADIKRRAAALDAFWEQIKDRLGITVERTARYLQWRLFENPNINYDFLLATDKGQIAGYVVAQLRKNEPGVGVITDLLCDPDNRTCFNTLLNAAVEGLKNAGADVVSFPTLASNNFLNRWITANGFVSLNHLSSFLRRSAKSTSESDKPVLLVKTINCAVNSERVIDPRCWYYTDLFTEGIL